MPASDSGDSTVQTVQPDDAELPVGPPPGRTYWFQLAQDDKDQWHWCLWGPNARIVAMSGVTFTQRSDAHRACERIKENVDKDTAIVVAINKKVG